MESKHTPSFKSVENIQRRKRLKPKTDTSPDSYESTTCQVFKKQRSDHTDGTGCTAERKIAPHVLQEANNAPSTRTGPAIATRLSSLSPGQQALQQQALEERAFIQCTDQCLPIRSQLLINNQISAFLSSHLQEQTARRACAPTAFVQTLVDERNKQPIPDTSQFSQYARTLNQVPPALKYNQQTGGIYTPTMRSMLQQIDPLMTSLLHQNSIIFKKLLQEQVFCENSKKEAAIRRNQVCNSVRYENSAVTKAFGDSTAICKSAVMQEANKGILLPFTMHKHSSQPRITGNVLSLPKYKETAVASNLPQQKPDILEKQKYRTTKGTFTKGGLRQLPARLAIAEDKATLSSQQIFLRNQIDVFKAECNDASTHTRGRNKPIIAGQVGIRCRHCAHLPVHQRRKGSTYFPSSIRGIYQAAQNMSVTHMQCGLCTNMPNEIKQEFAKFASSRVANSVGGRSYWTEAAKKLGLLDTSEGISFIGYITETTESQETWVATETTESQETWVADGCNWFEGTNCK